MSEITVSEIRAERANLQRMLLDLIRGFEEKTGCQVEVVRLIAAFRPAQRSRTVSVEVDARIVEDWGGASER